MKWKVKFTCMYIYEVFYVSDESSADLTLRMYVHRHMNKGLAVCMRDEIFVFECTIYSEHKDMLWPKCIITGLHYICHMFMYTHVYTNMYTSGLKHPPIASHSILKPPKIPNSTPTSNHAPQQYYLKDPPPPPPHLKSGF